MARLPSVLDEIDRLFDELVHRPWGAASRRLAPAELREVEDGWSVELPVEGMRAEDLTITVHGRTVTVTGERRGERAQKVGASGWSRTQQESQLQRTITLPAEVDPQGVDAKLHGALLTLHLRRRRK